MTKLSEAGTALTSTLKIPELIKYSRRGATIGLLSMGIAQAQPADLFHDPTQRLPSHVRLPDKVMSGRIRQVHVDLDLIERESIALNLFSDTVLIAERDRIVDNVNGHSAWIGHIQGEPGSEVVLAVKGRAMMGTVKLDNEVYEIVYAGNQTHTIRQIDPKIAPPHADGKLNLEIDAGPVSNETAAPGESAAAPANGTVVDLMVVYTPQARSNANGPSGIEAKIVNAVESANQAYLNSEINMQLNLVHMAEINYNESGDMLTSLNHLTYSDGQMDEVHAWRDQYGADQVALISADSNYCGIAWIMTNLSSTFDQWAFSVSHDDSRYNCLSNHTLAHELGHNQGNWHDRANSSGYGIYNYSFGHRICGSGGFKTVMSYSCSGAPTISHFSNPNIFYGSDPTGIDDNVDPNNSADAARSMNNAQFTIANWRPSTTVSTPNAPSGLAATAQSESGIGVGWLDNADNETGFKLERSMDGQNWSQIASLADNVSAFNDSGLNESTTYYYRVFAYNGTGDSGFSNIDQATTDTTVTPTAPNSPSSLVANAASGSRIDLDWQDNSDNETGFKVERSPNNSSWTQIASLGSSAESFADTGLNEATTYYYRVFAYNDAGDSPYSNTAQATTDGTALDNVPPTVIIQEPANGSTVNRTVRISVTGEDNVAVSTTRLYIDGQMVSSVNAASLSYDWNTRKAASGDHDITAQVWDAAGNFTETTVQVSVDNSSRKRGKGGNK